MPAKPDRVPGRAVLTGVGVAVTRPEHQSAPLIRLLEGAGATVLRLPLIAISEPEDPKVARAVVRRLNEFDLAVFVSANAVERGVGLVHSQGLDFRDVAVAAVGQATARALARRGLPVDVVPESGFDSESLLARDQLQSAAVSGRRVVIFRGQGGKTLLAETLRSRGARVEYAEVYRRAPPEVDIMDLLRPCRAGLLQVVLVTSGEALRNLAELVSPANRECLRHVLAIVVNREMASYAMAEDLAGEVIVAPRADDTTMVQALVDWRRAQQGLA